MAVLVRNRRLVALLCLTLLLLATLEAGASGLPVALLAPLWVFFGLTLWLTERLTHDSHAQRRVPALSHRITRAPPSACWSPESFVHPIR